jgi:hypothetical protein
VSVVFRGANTDTEVLAVKSVADYLAREVQNVKTGRVLSAKNEGMLRSAWESIGAVLESLPTDEGKASEPTPSKDATPDQGAPEATVKSSVFRRLSLDLAIAESDIL